MINNRKTCPDCGEAKSRSEFHKSATRKDGLRGQCKACQSRQQKEALDLKGRVRKPQSFYDDLDAKRLKYCPGCGETKPKSAFSKNATRKDGLATSCKTCGKRQQKEALDLKGRTQKPMQFYADLDAQGLRYCPDCETTKPKSEFYKVETYESGRFAYCRDCASLRAKAIYDPVKVKAQALKRNYGLDWDTYVAIYGLQGGQCEICGGDICLLPGKGRANKIGAAHVDHNHDTGNVRGLLCTCCNTGIGMLQDDSELLRNAADYLDSYKRAEDD